MWNNGDSELKMGENMDLYRGLSYFCYFFYKKKRKLKTTMNIRKAYGLVMTSKVRHKPTNEGT